MAAVITIVLRLRERSRKCYVHLGLTVVDGRGSVGTLCGCCETPECFLVLRHPAKGYARSVAWLEGRSHDADVVVQRSADTCHVVIRLGADDMAAYFAFLDSCSLACWRLALIISHLSQPASTKSSFTTRSLNRSHRAGGLSIRASTQPDTKHTSAHANVNLPRMSQRRRALEEPADTEASLCGGEDGWCGGVGYAERGGKG
ncbi:hypothetical protein KC367_g51 [Hortaea werneckii]|nr:hypothetical protein KC367_g51 [Hortaea werneckii]